MATTFNDKGKIYMNMTGDGKQYKRSTGLENTRKNLKYVEIHLLSTFI